MSNIDTAMFTGNIGDCMAKQATQKSETIGSGPRGKRVNKAPKRDRAAWLEVAKQALIGKGVERVKVEPLAESLGVTSGSFYHHFKNRSELLTDLLEDWERSNTEPLARAVEGAGDDPDAQFTALLKVWIAETDYNPNYDAAVRAWAHSSPLAEQAARRVDDLRIELLAKIFEKFGYDHERAFIRARVTYFHQVGYQAMGVMESNKRRLKLLDLYREVLIGTPPGKR
jgi:AcrR family transcriptional regulator